MIIYMLRICLEGAPAAGVSVSSRTRRRVVRYCPPCRPRTRGSSLARPYQQFTRLNIRAMVAAAAPERKADTARPTTTT